VSGPETSVAWKAREREPERVTWGRLHGELQGELLLLGEDGGRQLPQGGEPEKKKKLAHRQEKDPPGTAQRMQVDYGILVCATWMTRAFLSLLVCMHCSQ